MSRGGSIFKGAFDIGDSPRNIHYNTLYDVYVRLVDLINSSIWPGFCFYGRYEL